MVGTRRFRLSQRAVVFGKPGFIGVNGDFNIPNLPAYYNTPLTIATLSKPQCCIKTWQRIANGPLL
jgi:hypothetical protein